MIGAGVRTDSMIDKGRIIGLDSSKLSKPPKLCLATGRWRIQRRYSQVQEMVHRAAARISWDTNLSRRVFSLKKHGAHFDEKYLWD
jgi:hypothetical protein